MDHPRHGFRNVSIAVWLALLGAGLAGCKSWIRPGTDVPQSLNPFERGSAVLLPGADYHLAIVRPGPPIGNYSQDVLCEEPSPDWAIAFGTAFAGAASGGASGGPSGAVSGSATTTEAITALAGRTAGVVALRDGLYSACQAYANQLIGKDAYALILSQYGNLLVALASGGAGGGGAGATTPPPSSSTPPGVAVAVSTGGSSGSPSQAAPPPSGGTAQSGNPQVAVLQQQAVQAMLVACISYYDQSIPHAVNTVLQNNCGAFFSTLGGALPNLLKPQAQTAGQAATAQPSGAKVTPAAAKEDPIILLVQQKLNALNPSKIKADGIDGPQTDKALAAFQKDKNIPDGKPNDATLKALFQ